MFVVFKELCDTGTVVDHSVFVEDAWRMMHMYRISHMYREGNKCANCATKWVRELGDDVILFEDFPSQLRMQAQADALEVCYERL